MRKQALVFGFLLVLVVKSGFAQVVDYNFSTASSTYSLISGTSPILSGDGLTEVRDEGYTNGIPLGFTFVYDGINYTTISASTNGFASFKSISSPWPSNDLSDNGGSGRPILAPLWDNLSLQDPTDLKYTTVGVPGSRVFILQWNNVFWYASASSPSISFQLRLYETTNIVEFMYSQIPGSVVNLSGGASIGISDISTGSGSFLSLTNSGTSPGINSISPVNNISTRPATNQVYRFTPPACSSPGSTITNIGSTTADISWTSLTSASAYEYVVTTDYGTPVSGISTTLNQISLTGLTPGTLYYLYVRSSCGGGAFSSWSLNSFTTYCEAIDIPYVENFETASPPDFPECLRLQDLNGNSTWGVYSSPSYEIISGSNSMVYTFNSTTPGDDWFFLRGLNFTAGISYRLKFKYKAGSDFTEKLEVKYGEGPDESAMSTSLYSNTNVIGGPNTAIIDFTPLISGVYYIGFHDFSLANQDYLSIDDISVSITPSCSEPTDLSTSSITTSWASVSFNSTGNNFILEYGPHGFIPGTSNTPGVGGTIITSSVNTIDITGLLPGTSYDVYVRQICSGTDYSANSDVVSFTTRCDGNSVPYSENFDVAASPDIPYCTSVEDINGGSTWSTISFNARSNPNALVYQSDPDLPANDWFFTSPLNLTGGTSYRLSFYYQAGSSAFPEGLEVKYGDDNTSSAMVSSAIFSNTNIGNTIYKQGLVDFTPSVSGTYYIGFHAISIANQQQLYLDDINVDETPPCASPTNVTVSVNPTTATVNFTSSGSSFIVEYGPSGFTPGTDNSPGLGGTVISSASTSVVITGLTQATNYDVYVRQLCEGSYYSANSVLTSFLTNIINDEAVGALNIIVGASCTGATYSNVGATQSLNEPSASCSSLAGYATAWFKFTAPGSGAVRVSTDVGSGNTLTDTRMALFSATNVSDYSTFSIISCDEDGGSTLESGFMSVLYATGLIPGNTYYIQVDQFSSFSPSGSFCLTVDELNSSMLSSDNTCSSDYQTPNNSDAISTYTGWVPLLDGSSKLVALVKNQAGGAVDLYSVSQNVHLGSVRQDDLGRYYLSRNYRIANSVATETDIQFFFLNSELSDLSAQDGSTLSDLVAIRQDENIEGCYDDLVSTNGTEAYLQQLAKGTSNDVSWIMVHTPGFSNFYLTKAAVPVPVKFISFSGNKTNGVNFLSWSVVNESNVKGYEVERSLDGINYYSIGFVNTQSPSGTSSNQLVYSFSDIHVIGSKQYYRLKQIDLDGRSTYSNIVLIKENQIINKIKVDVIFPNPASANVNAIILAPSQNNITLAVTDISGRILIKKNVFVQSGSNTLSVNVANLTRGTYFIKLICESGCDNIVEKFIKL